MKIPRWTLRALGVALSLAAGAIPLRAQGVTTGAIAGTVTDAAGAAVEGAVVMATAKSNGFTTSTTTRSNGYYILSNLETGAYTLKIRRIGFESLELPVPVTLSQTTRFDIQLKQAATTLSGVTVTATTDASDFNPTRQGVSTQVSDSMITHIPQLNRNITDLAKLVPQVIIPSSGGPSAGGMYNRLNNFTVDGASQNDRFNLGSTGGVPGGAGNGRIISSDAVKEFRVLLTPTDVRQANFTGLLFNAVTKSGSNEFHGGLMYNYRHDANMASSNFRATPVDQRQYGFQLGGPIIKDRLTFYVAPEWQTRFSAAGGAFVGSTFTSTTPNINPDSIAIVQAFAASAAGLNYDAGTSGRVDVENPLTNLFGRLDFQLNSQHRMVLRRTDNTTENTSFSRNNNTFSTNPASQTTGFRLGSNGFTGQNTNASNVVQVFSNLTNGISNEFLAGFNKIRDERILNGALFPEIGVGVVPVGATGAAATNPTAAITFGSEQFSPFNLATQDIIEYQDNVSIPWNSHTFTLGGRYEIVKIYNNFPQALAGVWRFGSIAGLQAKTPIGYAVGIPNSGNLDDVPAVFRTNMPSAYLQDQWSNRGLTITAGVRADMPRFVSNPLDNQVFANQFLAGVQARANGPNFTYTGPTQVSTTWMPKDRVLWSPRVGFNYDISGDQTSQVRGNIGIYTAPPPFILAANALQNNGLGLVLLTCTAATGGVPAFTTDVNNLPKSCANSPAPVQGSFTTGTINLNDPNFKYMQVLGTSAGADHRLPFGFIGTIEGMYKKFINAPRIRDLNLLHPALNPDGTYKTDRNGRILYADSILLTGAVNNNANKALNVYQTTFVNPATGVTQTNSQTFDQGIIYLTNESKSYNYSLTGQLKRRFGNLDWTGAYTYNRAYDVQSLTSDRAISNWRNGREYSGLESADDLSTSAFERRHRVITYGTLVVPWTTRWNTDFTLFYEGVSGNPITYTANLDLNGDGWNANDPIYVPTNAMDTAQVRIGSLTGASGASAGTFVQDQAAALAFEQFIASQDCLNSQRGTIMKRDSCRGPWQNRMDLSIRQALPNLCGKGCDNVSVQLDVANVMNLAGEVLQHVDGVARDWGKTYGSTLSSFPQQQILAGNTSGGSSARTAGPTSQSQPVYTFNSTVRTRGPYDFAGNTGYNLALTVRYVF